jgi:hypothetical protein
MFMRKGQLKQVANKQASKQASKQRSKQASKQASKQGVLSHACLGTCVF